MGLAKNEVGKELYAKPGHIISDFFFFFDM